MPWRACSQATLWYFRWLSCKIPCVADIIILSLVSNICKAVPMALFWVTNILMDSTKKNRKAFQISLQPDWQIDKSIFNSQSCHILKSWYTGGVPEQRLQHWLIDRLSQKVYQKKHILKSKSSNVIKEMVQSSKLITVNYSLKSNFNVNSK